MVGVAKQFARTEICLRAGNLEPIGVNLGGGTFQREGWMNFDTRDQSKQEMGICISDFGQKKPLPLADGKVRYVNTSHCLDHIRDDVIDFILSDISRILRPGGSFLIKLPDFESMKEKHLSRDFSFFRNKWNIECVEKQWLVPGTAPNLEDSHMRCHINAFTPDELKSRLGDRGFEYVCQTRMHSNSEAYGEFKQAVSVSEFDQISDLSLYMLFRKGW